MKKILLSVSIVALLFSCDKDKQENEIESSSKLNQSYTVASQKKIDELTMQNEELLETLKKLKEGVEVSEPETAAMEVAEITEKYEELEATMLASSGDEMLKRQYEGAVSQVKTLDNELDLQQEREKDLKKIMSDLYDQITTLQSQLTAGATDKDLAKKYYDNLSDKAVLDQEVSNLKHTLKQTKLNYETVSKELETAKKNSKINQDAYLVRYNKMKAAELKGIADYQRKSDESNRFKSELGKANSQAYAFEVKARGLESDLKLEKSKLKNEQDNVKRARVDYNVLKVQIEKILKDKGIKYQWDATNIGNIITVK
ncbi:hypothetical protein EI427_00975 [Flammeovirga pectinis]|uniref:Lipoprotein n=1 Tax=Flammeovirga pectinis TaxID=2494373 RepID=A0A3Q9FJ26_9BACT|nr:hypothetical protein [Flammeovirga pectinis]AZQ60833.1 hypothetical protein EI427_00975 [Flammeovirga pectinis]